MRRGFTLLDLLIALAGITAAAALAIPFYFGQPDVTLENAAILLAEDLRTAQNRAAFLGEETILVPLDDGEGYRVVGADGRTIVHPRTGRAFVRDYPVDAVFRGVRLVSADLGDDGRLVYGPSGAPSEPASFTLAYRDDRRVVEITPPYGRLHVVGSTSGWIDLGD